MSERDLVRRCRGGEPGAWRELIRRFTPLVYRLSYRMLKRREEAEDVSQEVFLRMHRSFGTYDPTRSLSPWVARMTYNGCLRRLERPAKRGQQTLEAEELERFEAHDAPSPEDAATTSQAMELLERALRELPAQDRALLDLRYREGLSDSEVAEATGMPINTVKTRIFRARGRLRSWLTPLLRED